MIDVFEEKTNNRMEAAIIFREVKDLMMKDDGFKAAMKVLEGIEQDKKEKRLDYIQ